METINFGEENNSAPKAPNNRNKKLIWAGIILAVLILAVFGWQYWQYIQSPYYQQMKAVKEIEKMAKESDKWGGKTPEETVRLFTEAIKKGDFELAAKYGPIELGDPLIKNPETIKTELEKMKSEGKIEQLVKDLETAKLEENEGFNGNSFDLVIYENNKKYWLLSLGKSENDIWKIVEF